MMPELASQSPAMQIAACDPGWLRFDSADYFRFVIFRFVLFRIPEHRAEERLVQGQFTSFYS